MFGISRAHLIYKEHITHFPDSSNSTLNSKFARRSSWQTHAVYSLLGKEAVIIFPFVVMMSLIPYFGYMCLSVKCEYEEVVSSNIFTIIRTICCLERMCMRLRLLNRHNITSSRLFSLRIILLLWSDYVFIFVFVLRLLQFVTSYILAAPLQSMWIGKQTCWQSKSCALHTMNINFYYFWWFILFS